MTSPSSQPTGLHQYALLLWRRRWIILVALIAIPAVVGVGSLLQPTLYSSTARVIAQSQAPSTSIAIGSSVDFKKPDERELQTLASFIVTPESIGIVKENLHLAETGDDLRRSVSVEIDPNTDIIKISAQHHDPKVAASIANGFAEQFVKWRKGFLEGSLDESIKLITKQIATTRRGDAEYNSLIERRNSLELLKPMVSRGLSIGERARPSSSPSSPKPLRNVALATVAALILGVGLAFLREALDTKLHGPEEIASHTPLPIIATIPELHRSKQASSGRLITLSEPQSIAAEAYRFLRTNLEFINFDNNTRIIAVTSPLPGQGKSTTVANLAIALLRNGKRVAVVEGDLRRPSLHRLLMATKKRGVTDVVTGNVSLREATQVIRIDSPAVELDNGDTGLGRLRTPQLSASRPPTNLDLHVITSGPLPPNPGEIIGSPQFAQILDDLAAQHDYVLVDSPPMFAVGDTAAMATAVDGMLVILHAQETSLGTLREVEGFFERTPTRSLGLVITGIRKDTRRHAYYS